MEDKVIYYENGERKTRDMTEEEKKSVQLIREGKGQRVHAYLVTGKEEHEAIQQQVREGKLQPVHAYMLIGKDRSTG